MLDQSADREPNHPFCTGPIGTDGLFESSPQRQLAILPSLLCVSVGIRLLNLAGSAAKGTQSFLVKSCSTIPAKDSSIMEPECKLMPPGRSGPTRWGCEGARTLNDTRPG